MDEGQFSVRSRQRERDGNINKRSRAEEERSRRRGVTENEEQFRKATQSDRHALGDTTSIVAERRKIELRARLRARTRDASTNGSTGREGASELASKSNEKIEAI